MSNGSGNGIWWFQLVVSGTTPSRSASATHSTLAPRGAKPHLCQVPVQKSAPLSAGRASTWPGTWAASTKVSAPTSRAAAAIAAAGSSAPVGEVIRSVITSRTVPPPAATTSKASR
nr:hypothetical protein [Nocardioides panacis]